MTSQALRTPWLRRAGHGTAPATAAAAAAAAALPVQHRRRAWVRIEERCQGIVIVIALIFFTAAQGAAATAAGSRI